MQAAQHHAPRPLHSPCPASGPHPTHLHDLLPCGQRGLAAPLYQHVVDGACSQAALVDVAAPQLGHQLLHRRHAVGLRQRLSWWVERRQRRHALRLPPGGDAAAHCRQAHHLQAEGRRAGGQAGAAINVLSLRKAVPHMGLCCRGQHKPHPSINTPQHQHRRSPHSPHTSLPCPPAHPASACWSWGRCGCRWPARRAGWSGSTPGLYRTAAQGPACRPS